MTAAQLLEIHVDETWQSQFLRLVDLFDLLSECLIANDYSIPDSLSDSISLTDEGSALMDRLIRKERVPAKEARLMTALTIGHKDLFIDVEKTDFEALRSSIDRQVKDRRIQFPFTHGRLLYDEFSRLHATEKSTLTVAETQELLAALPQGVFQHGTHVTGPFGLIESLETRMVSATRTVAAFHCDDVTCEVAHMVHLSTGHDAPINSQRDRVRKILDENPDESSDWHGLARRIAGFEDSYFADTRSGTVASLLTDCFTDEELERLLMACLDRDGGELRKKTAEYLGGGDAKSMVRGRSRAELAQGLLVAKEQTLQAQIDLLAAAGEISVSRNEVRTPVLNRRYRTGAFRVQPELSALGVRFSSADPGLASLRLKRLLESLYDIQDPAEAAELTWQLREVPGEDLAEKLERFFRTSHPREAIEKLVLARRSNLTHASSLLGIQSAPDSSDEQLVQAMLWKLGFPLDVAQDPHAEFHRLLAKVSTLTESLRISGIGDSEEFRGAASNFFVELEGVLSNSLAFAAWSLLVDHTTQPSPFTYDDASDRERGLSLIREIFESQSNEVEHLELVLERPDIYPLMRGFMSLANHLEELSAKSPEFRETKELPDFVGKTDLKDFVFRSKVPFQNLQAGAQERIVEELRRVGTTMVAADVNGVRANYFHYRRLSPDIEHMSFALEAVRTAVRTLEQLGFCTVLYVPNGRSTDRWGRTLANLSASGEREAVFARPSRFDWMGLPSLDSPQYLVRSAIFAEPNEMLRFGPRFSNSYSQYWSDFPKRRIRLDSATETPLK